MVKLFVGNLPPSASNQSLKEIFQQYKDLQDFKLISNYGFVYLETEESAIHAVNNLNGLEYRGFTIAIDFARENNKLKRKADLMLDNRSAKSFVGPQQRFAAPPVAPPVTQQRNMNPYNLPFLNNNTNLNLNLNPGMNNMNNGGVHSNHNNNNCNSLATSNTINSINRSFENLVERRYGYNSNNNGFDSGRPIGAAAAAAGGGGGYLHQHQEDAFEGPMTRGRAPFTGASFADDYYDQPGPGLFSVGGGVRTGYNQSQGLMSLGGGGGQDSFYGGRPPLAKKFRSESFVEDDVYDFSYSGGGGGGGQGRYGHDMGGGAPMMPPARDTVGYRSGDYEHPMMRTPAMSILKRPNWYETNHKMNHQFLSSERDQHMFVPRRGNRRQMKKSYIDEYEDNNDYSETDPYPAYLKQYQK